MSGHGSGVGPRGERAPVVNLVVSLSHDSIEELTTSIVNALKRELHLMSDTLQKQIQDATAAIQADVQAVGDDLTNLGSIATTIQGELANLGTIQPGTTVTADDVAALQNVKALADQLKASADASVSNLQNIANAGTVANTGSISTGGTIDNPGTTAATDTGQADTSSQPQVGNVAQSS
jgi:phage-related protein